MIMEFSRHGKGNGKGAIQYFTSPKNPNGTDRTPSPVVVRRLIDALEVTEKYTSGVLRFRPGEDITRGMEEQMMEAFEHVAFAGLEREQYRILWVRHSHAGHHELHFLVPRIELSTDKSLNIAPPGNAARELFETFRSQINARYGFADPEDRGACSGVPDPARAAALAEKLERLSAARARSHQQRYGRRDDTLTRHHTPLGPESPRRAGSMCC
jgi:hypothetical protein